MPVTTTLTCPRCGRRAREVIPDRACVIVYDCGGCGAVLRPKEGDCCVFCSYAEHRCPTAPKGGCG